MSDPVADPALIANFLESERPDGQWVLGAIPVNGGAPKVCTFDDALAAGNWAAAKNANKSHNLYWTSNRLLDRMTRKPAEADVAEVLFLYADIDPQSPSEDASDEDKMAWNRAERERILAEVNAFEPRPNLVVDSGGGYQCFWRLDTPCFVAGDDERIIEMKAYNIGLRDAFTGADSVQSLDHFMRLPFTVNWPNANKRKRGRKAQLATVVWRDGSAHLLSSFSPACDAAPPLAEGHRQRSSTPAARPSPANDAP